MKGSGTSADPFVVNNYEEFENVSWNSHSELHISFNPDAEDKIIDMNDIYPTGVPCIKMYKTVHIYGNGWEIRNMFLDNGSGWLTGGGNYGLFIYNLKLTNFYITSRQPLINMISASAGGIYFYSCQFSGLFFGEYFLTLPNQTLRYDSYYSSYNLNCGVSQFHFISNYIATGAYGNFSFNNVKIKSAGTGTNDTESGKFGLLNCAAVMANNKFELYFSKPCNYVFSNMNSTYFNYICGKLESKAFVSHNTINNRNINLYNSDTITGFTLPTSDNVWGQFGLYYIGCTTEQLKDANYLSELGFPIGVE